jgi:hypothetical protein
MNITYLTNSALARSVSLDPSLISRLRRGVRSPAKNENYIKPMSIFFAKHILEEYQKKALAKTLNISEVKIPTDIDVLSDLIYKWLYGLYFNNNNVVQSFMDALTDSPSICLLDSQPLSELSPEASARLNRINISVFYGLYGKQTAALEFLSLVLGNPHTRTLYLFSDENIDWLISDRNFVQKWSMLLIQIIKKGNKIKIIHTVNRGFSEMLSAIKQWLPLYMTGAIEPYYYPKKRDGILQRTLFIAPGIAAITSDSVGMKIDNTVTFLLKDKKTLLALEYEFNNYCILCRPLMKIFTNSRVKDFFKNIEEFEKEPSNILMATETLSTITMPSSVLDSILARTGLSQKEQLPTEQKNRIKIFEETLNNYTFNEIINIPDIKKVRSGHLKISLSNMFCESELYYGIGEYISHLENIIRLLKEYRNFNIILSTNDTISGFMLYVKEDVGILVTKSSTPTVMFVSYESNLTAAFWDYLKAIIKNNDKSLSNKSSIITELEDIIFKLVHN